MLKKLESITAPPPDRHEPALSTAQTRFAQVVGRAIAEDWWRQHSQPRALSPSLPKLDGQS